MRNVSSCTERAVWGDSGDTGDGARDTESSGVRDDSARAEYLSGGLCERWGSKIAGRVPFWSASRVGIVPEMFIESLQISSIPIGKSPQKSPANFLLENLYYEH